VEQLIDVVLKGLGALLVGALITLVGKLLQRMGIALDVERQQQVESMARQAVAKIEEIAANQAKARVRDWTGGEKLSAAVADVVAKLPRVSHEEAVSIVQAVLPSMGIGAAAGAAELGKALRTQ